MRGRKPKPTHLKLLAGNPGHRPINKDEPEVEPVTELQEPPAHLSGEARTEWFRVLPILIAANLIADVDMTAFAAYCQAYGRWVEAESYVARQGAVLLHPTTGVPILNPYLSVANKAADQMRSMLVEFGMTPSSRSRVKLPPKGESKNPYAKFKTA